MDKILLELDEKQEKEKEVAKTIKEIKALKRKRNVLVTRDAKVRNNINAGQELETSDLRLPLTVVAPHNRPGTVTSGQEQLSQPEIAQLRRTTELKMRLKATAMCYGVTCMRDEANDETKYMFDPYIAGRPYGPYVLRIKYSNKGIVLRGQSLPHAVPVKTLYNKHITESSADRATKMQSFLEDISQHLRGFLSRQHQFNEFKSRFATDLLMCNASHHCTAISFTLKVEDEDEVTMKVDISLLYDKHGERPKEGSVQVNFTPELDDESLDNIREQVEVFYELSLSEAVEEAFM